MGLDPLRGQRDRRLQRPLGLFEPPQGEIGHAQLQLGLRQIGHGPLRPLQMRQAPFDQSHPRQGRPYPLAHHRVRRAEALNRRGAADGFRPEADIGLGARQLAGDVHPAHRSGRDPLGGHREWLEGLDEVAEFGGRDAPGRERFGVAGIGAGGGAGADQRIRQSARRHVASRFDHQARRLRGPGLGKVGARRAVGH